MQATLPNFMTDRLDKLAALLEQAPAMPATSHPTEGIAWSYVVRDAVDSVLRGLVEITDWTLQDAMPTRQGVAPISLRLYLDASTRNRSIKREPAQARAILERLCLAVIQDPTVDGLAVAQAQLLADTRGYWQ
jgi:hypothetical protein